MVVSKVRRQLPRLWDAKVMGSRLRRAMQAAGYRTQAQAIRKIQAAVPGTRFSRSEMSALVNGYKEPMTGRLLVIAYILGLDIRILFPEFFASEGASLTRRSRHPRGPAEATPKRPSSGSRPRTAAEPRNPPGGSSTTD